MFAVVWIAPLAGRPDISTTRLTDLLNLHITPADRVEHLSVREQSNRMAVFGFLMAGSPHEARNTLTRLVRVVIAGEPDLRLWRVV